MPGFEKGELILCSTPYAHVLHAEYRSRLCDYCFKAKSDLKRCGQCSFLYYCNRSCQIEAWKTHKTVCKFIKRAGDQKPDDLTRLFALIILKLKKCGPGEPSEEVGGQKVSFASLKSHAKELEEDAENYENMKGCLAALKRYIGPHNVPSLAEFTEIYGKSCTNILNITSEINAVGCGLYLGASVLHHSCEPDAAIVYDGTTLNARMRKSVPHRSIKKVSVALLGDVLMVREERQKYLWENRYFRCECSLCISPQSDEMMTKLVDDAPETKAKALKCRRDLEILKLIPSSDLQDQYEACKKLLKIQSDVLASTNICKLKTLRHALAVCLALEKWDDARTLASSLEEPLKMYYGPNHPLMGYFLFSFGKILFHLKCYKEAAAKMAEALVIFEVTHGKEHPTTEKLDSFMTTVISKMYKNSNVISVRKLLKQS